MNSFYCGFCNVLISDNPLGYRTGCVHYPVDKARTKVIKKDKVTRSFVFNNLKGRIDSV